MIHVRIDVAEIGRFNSGYPVPGPTINIRTIIPRRTNTTTKNITKTTNHRNTQKKNNINTTTKSQHKNEYNIRSKFDILRYEI